MTHINYSRIIQIKNNSLNMQTLGPDLGLVPCIFVKRRYLFPHQTEYSRFPCFHCYTLGGAIMHILNESRKCRSKTQTRKMQKLIISYVRI